MKVGETLERDPAAYQLVNNGQARIADRTDERVLRELKGELSSFVCEGQFADGMQLILSSYLGSLGQTGQKAAWVSGFFGSGKSHLLKMLGHLWQDTRFADGSTARGLVPGLPEELRHLLRELDTAGRRAGGLLAAAGALPSGSTDNVRLTVAGVLLRAAGLPDQYAPAQFCLWLHEQGQLRRVKDVVEATGRAWLAELNNLYVSGPIARALIECDPHFAANDAEARKTIREQFPQRTSDITTSEFLSTFKRALRFAGKDGKPPCTVLILDEVQQYIGDSNGRSTLLTEVVEAVSKQLDSHVIVVGAGQSALTSVKLLGKLMDRFTIRVASPTPTSKRSRGGSCSRRRPARSARFARRSRRTPERSPGNSRGRASPRARTIAAWSWTTTRCSRFGAASGSTASARSMPPAPAASSARSFASSTMRWPSCRTGPLGR
jgi:hypothetical protein